ncbi:hypothetical protein [Nocardia sp. NPDC127526]|uniref:hypothetical protein n=1 Tax=Nocardia sp. NPDC127526 TaxID=3345393 RepID=UPI003625EB4A
MVEALLRYAEDLASVADTGDIRRDLADFPVALADAERIVDVVLAGIRATAPPA